jgi:hypothetical protein
MSRIVGLVFSDPTSMLRYLKEAYAKRTSTGLDDITAGMILHAHKKMKKALLLLIRKIAETCACPADWKKLRIVLAYKPGRDPCSLTTGYRPIGVGSLLLKAFERVLKKHFEEALAKRPLHRSILAYQKGLGHDMANAVLLESAPHHKFKLPDTKLFLICRYRKRIQWDVEEETTEPDQRHPQNRSYHLEADETHPIQHELPSRRTWTLHRTRETDTWASSRTHAVATAVQHLNEPNTSGIGGTGCRSQTGGPKDIRDCVVR